MGTFSGAINAKKVKCAILLLVFRRRVTHLPSQGPEPVGGNTTIVRELTHGQCDARPIVTFPAARHHRPLAGTKLYCLVTETHVC